MSRVTQYPAWPVLPMPHSDSTVLSHSQLKTRYALGPAPRPQHNPLSQIVRNRAGKDLAYFKENNFTGNNNWWDQVAHNRFHLQVTDRDQRHIPDGRPNSRWMKNTYRTRVDPIIGSVESLTTTTRHQIAPNMLTH